MTRAQVPLAERRAYPRYPTGWWTELERDTKTLEGVILNVSVGGALIRLGGKDPLRAGDNLQLRFRPGDSMRMAVCARVRWVGNWSPELGCQEVGISFYDLPDAKRGIIVEQAREWLPEREFDVTVEKKTLVRSSGAYLWVWLSGALSATESARVHALVAAQASGRVGRPLLAYIDIRRLQTCRADSLESIRRWLRLVGRATPFGAVLAASEGVALRQFSRLAEDTQVSDSIRVVTEGDKAVIAWRTLEKAVRGLGLAS